MTSYERAYLQGFTEALSSRGLTKSAQSITGYVDPAFNRAATQFGADHPTAAKVAGGVALAVPAALTAPLWMPALATAGAAAGPALAAGAGLATRYGKTALDAAKTYGPAAYNATINAAKTYGPAAYNATINAAKTYGPAAYNATINAAKTYGPAAWNATKHYGATALNAATRVGAPVMNRVNMVREGWNKLPEWSRYAIPPVATMGAGLGYKTLDVLFGFDPLGSLDDDKRTVPTLTLSEEQRFNDQQDQDPQSERHNWNGPNGTYNGAYKPNTDNSSRDAYGDVDFLNYGE